MGDPDLAEMGKVEQGQALREKLAVDDALAEAGDDPEADPARQLVQSLADAAHVARLDMLHAVPEHDPVDAGAVGLGALGAAVPDQLGVEARAADPVGLGVDLADQVEVDEAVVDRSDQGIGADHCGAGVGIVAAGRVDDDDLDVGRQAVELGLDRLGFVGIERFVRRHDEVDAEALHRLGAVVEIAAEGALAGVEVESGDPAAGGGERDGAVHGRGRLAGAAFLIGENDEMRRRHLHPLIFLALIMPYAPRKGVAQGDIGGDNGVQIVRDIEGLRAAVADLRSDGATIALVPTMGALHAGHMALVAEGRRRAGQVVASIFVNPTQFAANEDLSTYPRREASDARMLEEEGCALLWAPDVEAMYPNGFEIDVRAGSLGEDLDGAARTGHFDGVATIVSRLFDQVRPDIALFGEKDYQQLAVIRQMVRDRKLAIEIIGVPTQRDADGLALSSRNAYLTDEERQTARALPRALGEAAAAIQRGGDVGEALAAAKERLAKAGFDPIDYVELRDAESLAPVTAIERPARLLAAARIGRTRLIDNLAVEPA
jgi:pantoate--beta-alanine ligase